MLFHKSRCAERKDGCRRDHNGKIARLGSGARAFGNSNRRDEDLRVGDRADDGAARGEIDGHGRLAGFIGEDAGLRAVQRDLRADDGSRDGIPVLVIARADEGQLRRVGRDKAGIEGAVHVAPGGQVGVDEGIHEIAVGNRVGKGPRGCAVDVVAVAAAVFRAPELVHRDAVFARGRFVSGIRAAVEEFIMRDDHGVVDRDRTVAVRVVNDEFFLRDGEFAALIGNGDEHAGILSGIRRGSDGEGEDEGGEEEEDFFHESVLLSEN